MRTNIGRAVAVLVLVAAVASCTPRDVAVDRCHDPARPLLVVDDPHTVPWPAPSLVIANHTTIEASGRTWAHDEPNDAGFRVGIKIHRPDVPGSERVDVCVVGGTVATTLDPEATPWTTWHLTYGFVQENPDATMVGLRVFDTGDAITFTHRAENWRVVGVRADGLGLFRGAYVHDDCVEDDSMFTGVVVDSKFDGCHVFLSADAGEVLADPPDGTGRTVQIERTLVRLQGYEQSFDPAKYGTGRHGGFFKFAGQPERGTPPQLVVRDSTFRSDEAAPYGGNLNGPLGLPPGSVCEDVVLVGAESWPARDRQSWVDECTGLRFGTVADWDAQVAQWDADHPML